MSNVLRVARASVTFRSLEEAPPQPVSASPASSPIAMARTQRTPLRYNTTTANPAANSRT